MLRSTTIYPNNVTAPTNQTFAISELHSTTTWRTLFKNAWTPCADARRSLWTTLKDTPDRTQVHASEIWQAYITSLRAPSLPQPLAGLQTPTTTIQQLASASTQFFDSANWEMHLNDTKPGYAWFTEGESRLMPLLLALKANPCLVVFAQTPFWIGLAFSAAAAALFFVSTVRARLSIATLLISFTAALLVLNIAFYPLTLGPTSCSFAFAGHQKLIHSSELIFRGLRPQAYALPTQVMPSIRDPLFSKVWTGFSLHPDAKKSEIVSHKHKLSKTPQILEQRCPASEATRNPLYVAPFYTPVSSYLADRLDFSETANRTPRRPSPRALRRALKYGYTPSLITTPYHHSKWYLPHHKIKKLSIFDKRWTLFEDKGRFLNQAFLQARLKTSEAYNFSYQLQTLLIDQLAKQQKDLMLFPGTAVRTLSDLSYFYSQEHALVSPCFQGLLWSVNTANPRSSRFGCILLPQKISSLDRLAAELALVEERNKREEVVEEWGFEQPELGCMLRPTPMLDFQRALRLSYGPARMNFIYSAWIDMLANRSDLWHRWARGNPNRMSGRLELISYNQLLLDFEVNPQKNRFKFWLKYPISYEWFKGITGPQEKNSLLQSIRSLNPLPAVRIHKEGNLLINSDVIAQHQLAKFFAGGAWLAAPSNIVITCASLIGSLFVIIFSATNNSSAASAKWKLHFVAITTKLKAQAEQVYVDLYNFKRLYFVHGGIGFLEFTGREKLKPSTRLTPLFIPANPGSPSWWIKSLKRLSFTEFPVLGGAVLIFLNINLLPSGEPALVVGSMFALAVAHLVYHKVPRNLDSLHIAGLLRNEQKKVQPRSYSKSSWLFGEQESHKGAVAQLYTQLSEHRVILHRWGIWISMGFVFLTYVTGHFIIQQWALHKTALISVGCFAACVTPPSLLSFIACRPATAATIQVSKFHEFVWVGRRYLFFGYLWLVLAYIGATTNPTGWNSEVTLIVLAIGGIAAAMLSFKSVKLQPHYHRALLTLAITSYVWLNLYAFGFFFYKTSTFALTVGCLGFAAACCSKIPTNLVREASVRPGFERIRAWDKGLFAVLVATSLFWLWEIDPSQICNTQVWHRESYPLVFAIVLALICAVISFVTSPLSLWRGLFLCVLSSVVLLWAMARCASCTTACVPTSVQTSAALVLCFWTWSFVRLWRYFIIVGTTSAYASFLIVLLPSIVAVQNNLSINYIGVNNPTVLATMLLAELLTMLFGVVLLPPKWYPYNALKQIGFCGIRTQSAKQLFFIFAASTQLYVAALSTYLDAYQLCICTFLTLFSMYVTALGLLLWATLSSIALSDKISELRGALNTSRFLYKYLYVYLFSLLSYCGCLVTLAVYAV